MKNKNRSRALQVPFGRRAEDEEMLVTSKKEKKEKEKDIGKT